MEYSEYLKNKYVYQEQGTQLLLEKKHACLFYKPGKGKTYPVVDALQQLEKLQKSPLRVLILSTKDAIENMWLSEIAPQNILPEATVFMTFNGAIMERTRVSLLNIKWDVIVVDECHKIKAHNSKISKLIYLLTENCEYAWGLTGTPRGNNDVDIYCQLHNLNVSEWGAVTYTRFINTMCTVDTKFFYGIQVIQPTGIKAEYKAGWEKNLAEFTQRIDYDEADNMPKLNTNVVYIPFEKSKEYKDAEQGILQIGEYETTMTKLIAINKMHQAANGYVYWTDEQDIRHTHKFKENSKLSYLAHTLKFNPNCIIVYQYQQDFEDLSSCFLNEWTDDVNEFKSGKKSILLLQSARCESFNLQMCKNIVFYTMDYSYIKYNQMMHRVWRMGQDADVNITILLFKGSVEEQIWQAVQRKEKAADLFMSVKGAI